MSLLQEIQHLWTKIDPRVIDLPLIQSSYHVPLMIFAYLYLVLECGPRFMKNRRPYLPKTFIKLYNIIKIVANIWLVYDHIDAGLFTNSNLTCPASLDYSYDYTPMRAIYCGPNVKKSIAPMKQWIIKAQLVQLVIMILYNSQNFLPGCKVVEHYWIDIIIIGYLMMNFYLFYNFYQKAKPKRKI